MRFPDWPEGVRLPELGDIAQQTSGPDTDDVDDVRRSYLVVGVEEGRSPRSFRLIMERVEHGTVPARARAVAIWRFHNTPR